jgi:hypothetical protein
MSKYASPIKIKPSRVGKLHEDTHTAPGEKIPLAKEEKALRSEDPEVRQRANFAINVRNWSHYRKKG